MGRRAARGDTVTLRVLITRPTGQSGPLEAALERQGLEPVSIPAISVEVDPPGGQLDIAARVLHTFDWVVITSPNGARAILTAAERVFTALGSPSWAVIGDVTAAVLEREGMDIDFKPSRPDGRTMGDELPIRAGQEILILRSDLADQQLPSRLRERGATVVEVTAYRVLEAPLASASRLRDIFAAGLPAAVVFASGSAVRGLIGLAEADRVAVRSIPAVCIGRQTAGEARSFGFDVVATAPTPDPVDLAATVAAALLIPLETT